MSTKSSIRNGPSIERLEKEMNRRIGQRLRVARLLRGMTQGNLAGALGISYQQIQRYEQGGTNITPAKLSVLAQTVGVPITYFFDGEGVDVKGNARFGQRLLHLIRRLPGIERNDPDLFMKICRLVMTPRVR